MIFIALTESVFTMHMPLRKTGLKNGKLCDYNSSPLILRPELLVLVIKKHKNWPVVGGVKFKRDNVA